MAKNTMGTRLSRKLEQKMSLMGEQIKLARLRRKPVDFRVCLLIVLQMSPTWEYCFRQLESIC